MKTVNKNSVWLPGLLDNLLFENRIDAYNYETFSTPAINIIENFPNFVVELAAPGLKKENFSIEVEDDTLKITSNKYSENEETENQKDTKFLKKEFNFKSFKRSFKLPENINTEYIQANYEDGILRITLPKLEEKKALKKMVEIS